MHIHAPNEKRCGGGARAHLAYAITCNHASGKDGETRIGGSKSLFSACNERK